MCSQIHLGRKEGKENTGEMEGRGRSNFSITGNTIKKIGESWPSPTSRFLFGRSLFAFQSANPRAARRNFQAEYLLTLLILVILFSNRLFAIFERTNFRSLSNDPRKAFKRFEPFTSVNGVESQWEAAILRILICGNWNST